MSFAIELMQCRCFRRSGQGGGELSVDPRAVWNSYSLGEKCGSETEHYSQIVKYNSSEPGFSPCPHLVDLYVVVERCTPDMRGRLSPLWETDTVWKHPLFADVDQNRQAWELMADLAAGSENDEFLPEEPHQFEKFGDCWTDFAEPGRLFDVRGTAVFACDAAKFVRELVEKAELLQKARRAGRDTRAEWDEIKKQREKETVYSDYEDEYEDLPEPA